MKKIIILSLSIFTFVLAAYSQEKINVVVIGAHPDDCDIDAGGTALKYAQMGHRVLFVSLTNGDAGHHEKGGGALARIRRAEAQEAGKRLGVSYTVLDNHDAELMPTLENRHQIIRIIREWKADVVISHRPYDYHPDHRNAALLVQDAAFLVVVPNVVSDVPALKKNPVFLYSHDSFQKPSPFKPDIAVDITDVVEQKIYGMAAHESQFFEWLPWLNGTLDQVPATDEQRVKWLAGFRISPIGDELRQSLVKWYGAEKGAQVKIAESFEICEFGRHPSDDEIRRLFPMMGK
ncbi:PIG-L family deacetylase [Maribellus sp. CM-23]|uniref:PIG-L deacetylase family protein n=1 Tax=Maribellus sp. CM-23 TaxID=2781026 RepID=UPI001F448A4A|nr:PIG-L deacetylase family protein [Maribellus sp. CM-23]MCE4563654.1 PIG-L family deacetylase [Maribellus sp. CM-23]